MNAASSGVLPCSILFLKENINACALLFKGTLRPPTAVYALEACNIKSGLPDASILVISLVNCGTSPPAESISATLASMSDGSGLPALTCRCL